MKAKQKADSKKSAPRAVGRKTILSAALHLLCGLAMMGGALFAAAQPEASLDRLLLVLGLLLLLGGLAGLVGYFRLSGKPSLKDRAALALGVLMMILGALMLLAPAFLAPALRWAAAAAFAAMGLAGLLKWIPGVRAKASARFALLLSLLLLAAAALIVFRPLPAVLTLPLLVFCALLLAGAEQLIRGFSLFKKQKSPN